MNKTKRPLLVIAHPGHELRLFGWMVNTRPEVLILTDGSGSSGQSRLKFTHNIVAMTGCTLNEQFKPLSDRTWYKCFLERDAQPIIDACIAIAEGARRLGSGHIVSDAVDGYNPMHDTAFDLAASACSLIQRSGRDVVHWVCPATGTLSAGSIAMKNTLSPETQQLKLNAMQSYLPLCDEITGVLLSKEFDISTEYLYNPVNTEFDGGIPYYEEVGRGRIRDKLYVDVIQRERDVEPLIKRACHEIHSKTPDGQELRLVAARPDHGLSAHDLGSVTGEP